MSEKDEQDALTAEEERRLAHFERLFANVEQLLKRRLGLSQNDRTGVSKLIDLYKDVNPFWINDAHLLRRMCNARNIIVHERNESDGYPLAVPAATVRRLREILSRLQHEEPVAARFSCMVNTVDPDDSLASVLTLVYNKEYSQFPVLASGRFKGIITENGITRWLGQHIQKTGHTVDLSSIAVRDVIKEEGKEVGRRGNIYIFVCSDKPADEVIGLFATRRMLEVVLITANGKSGSEPLLGIVTTWDASRYRPTLS